MFEHIYIDNNINRNTEPVQIELADYPDLEVSGVVTQRDEATAGSEVVVEYTITNTGTASAGEWIDSVYISSIPLWNPDNIIALRGIRHTTVIEPDENIKQRTTVRIPNDISGEYYIYVVSDAADALFEFPDDENNVARSQALFVEEYPPIDLQVDINTVDVQENQTVTLLLEYTVSNIGEAATRESEWNEEIYLSSNTTLDTELDILISEIAHQGVLSGGRIVRRKLDLEVPPGVEGDFHVVVIIDPDFFVNETSKDNNIVHSDEAIEISIPPPIDLIVKDITIPDAFFAGDEATVMWTVQNDGDGTMGEVQWVDAVYLSRDRSFDKSDILLGFREQNGPLESQNAYSDSLTFTVPPHASGPYYLLFITNSRDNVYEHLGEGNNIAPQRIDITLPEPTDLIVTDLVIPEAGHPGEEIVVSWTVRNLGENHARGILTDGVYLSEDTEWHPDDPLVGVREHRIDLPSGQSSQIQIKTDLAYILELNDDGEITERLPAVLPGEYYGIVRTNITRSIRETDYDNNTVISSSEIHVNIESFEVGTTVELVGTREQNKYFQFSIASEQDVRISLLSDIESSANEIYIAKGRLPVAGGDYDFAAAEPFVSDQDIILPSLGVGDYYLLIANHSLPSAINVQNLIIEIEPLGFSVISLSRKNLGQGQVTMNIVGSGFRESMNIALKQNGNTVTEGELLTYHNTTNVEVRWRLDDVPAGAYDLELRNPDGQSVVLENAIDVESPTIPELRLHSAEPDAMRVSSLTPFRYEVENIANVDISYAELRFVLPSSVEIRNIQSGLFSTMSRYMELFAHPEPSDVRLEEDSKQLLLWKRNIPAGDKFTVSFSVAASENPMALIAYSKELSRDQWLRELNEIIEYLRQRLVSSPINDDPDWLSIISDREAFAQKAIEIFTELGMLLPTEVDNGVINYDTESSLSHELKNTLDDGNGTSAALLKSGTVGSDIPETYQSELSTQSAQQPPSLFGCLVRIFQCAGPFTKCPGIYDWIFDEGGLPSDCGKRQRNRCKPVLGACDPNDILGPEGYGSEKWIGVNQTLPYTIRFENDPELATAPAQVVNIRHPLDETVDIRSFRLGSFGFGSFSFQPPENLAHYRTRLDVRDSLDLYVDLTAGIDVINHEAFWIFRSIDPETGEQPVADPFAGFLPVNDTTGIGEGFVNYTIRSDQNARSGDVIDAEAGIIFDGNPPIETPPIFNTIDAELPVSHLQIYPGNIDTTAFELRWVGEDVGAGIGQIDIYVAKEDGPFEIFQSGLTDSSAIFIGEPDVNYHFFSIAADNAGNVEPMKTTEDAISNVGEDGSDEDFIPQTFTLFQNYPNPFNPTTTILYDIPQAGAVEIGVYNTLGQRVMVIHKGDMIPGRHSEVVDFSRFASGVYFYEIRVKGPQGMLFRDVKKLVFVK